MEKVKPILKKGLTCIVNTVLGFALVSLVGVVLSLIGIKLFELNIFGFGEVFMFLLGLLRPTVQLLGLWLIGHLILRKYT